MVTKLNVSHAFETFKAGAKAKLDTVRTEAQRRLATPGRPYVPVALPTPLDHPNNGAPRALLHFAEKVDAVIPDKLRDRGYSMTKLVKSERDEDTTPLHYVVSAGIVAAGADIYADAFSAAMASGTLPWVMGAATAAIFPADVGIARWHKWMDQYSDKLGKFGFFSAQVHHDTPNYMAKYSPARKAFQSWRVLPALGLMALGEPTTTLGAIGQVVANTTLLSAVSSFFVHGWVHSTKPRLGTLKDDLSKAGTLEEKKTVVANHVKWGTIDALQKGGLILDREYHAGHHAGRREGLLTGERSPRFLHNHGVAGGWLTGGLTRWLEKGDRPLLDDKAMYTFTKLLTGEGWEPLSAFSTPEAYTVWNRYRDNPKDEARVLVQKDRVDALQTRIDFATQNISRLQGERKNAAGEKEVTQLDGQIDQLQGRLTAMQVDYDRVSKEWGVSASQATNADVMSDETIAKEATRLANQPIDAQKVRALVTQAVS